MKLGGYKVVVDIPAMSPELFEVITGYQPKTIPALVAAIGVAVSTHNMTESIMPGGSGVALDLGGPAAVLAACTGWVHQDDDAHETCSLTACLNPLHPGPCKGWKGNLFKVAPSAYHALESARVEKANAARIKKIQALKDAGKPIPKKLLTPIVAKPHPHAGQTANAATGEAHHAGQAVSEAAGVHAQHPGKVTLGQAVKQIKATDATPEKGPKGKKPTVASKGIAAVIAQEKVTPQYKLDKAAKITPEQWNALSGDEKSVIRGELAKIQKEGFGPQQKKATELLDSLPANGLKGGGTDTVTTPKGHVIQKVTLKDLENPPTSHPSPIKALAPEGPKAEIAPHHTPLKPGEPLSKSNYTPAMKNASDMAQNFASPPQIHALQKAFHERFGAYQKLNAEEWKALPESTRTAIVHDVIGAAAADQQLHQGFIDEKGKAFTPASAWLARRNIQLPALEQGKIDKYVPQFAKGKPTKPEVTAKIPEKTTVEAKNVFGEYSKIIKVNHPKPESAKIEKAAQAAGKTPPAKPETLNDKVAKVKEEMGKGSSLSEAVKKVTGKEPAPPEPKTPEEAKKAHEAKIAESEAKIAASEKKLAELKAKGVQNAAALDVLKKQTALVAPDGTPYTTKTPTNVVKDIKKNGYADLILGGKKIRVGFEDSEHPGKLSMTNGTGIDSFYTVKEPDGTVHKLAKGEHVKVATPDEHTPKIGNGAPSAPEKTPALPQHVQHAAAMANHEAPGAGLSKNHLAAYQKLTPEEFNALPDATQSKIIQELEKGKTKFLDPKKVTASQQLIEKFQAGKPKSSAPAADVGFHSHMTDHTVTTAQAKKAASGQPVAAHAAVAKELAGLELADQPDVMAHHNAAKQYASDLTASFVKDDPQAALKDPAVQQEMENVAAAAYALKQAQLVGIAKKNAYNKIDKVLNGDQGKLSPIQKASLAEYQKYLLAHPANTDPVQIAQLQIATLDATDALKAKLKAAKAPKAADMNPGQIKARTAELLGPEAVKPNINLTMSEIKETKDAGKQMADTAAAKYSAATLENPEVAAKQKDLAVTAGQYAAAGANAKKLQEHLKQYHYKALNEHAAGNGDLTDADAKVIEAHATQLKAEHAFVDNVFKLQQDKLTAAHKAFQEAADKVENTPHEPVTLSEYDKGTIADIYGNNWAKQASNAVLYGVKTWNQKSDMKSHPDYASFTQDLGVLQTAVKNLALAHAAEHVAGLNVPTDPDTGAKLPGPEKQAWLTAVSARMKAEADYQKLHKSTQSLLDKIRTDIGLKKRSLPKIDSPALKSAAAESAYYKTGGYSGPNYGKPAAAKSYTLAKVGPKLGVKHQSAAEKKAEKAAAEAEKLKAAHPDFYAKKEADKAKPKTAAPSFSEAGPTPTKQAAEKYGWNYTAQAGPPLGEWTSHVGGGAYYANDEHLKAAQDILTGPDVQHGLAAQKQFKWSIGNMQDKGATAASRNSLYSYTGDGYTSVNQKLNSLPPGVEKTGSTSITNIDNGMAASPPLESDVVLYRGFSNPHSVFSSGKWNDTNVAGMEWSQRSYSSTSGSLATAQGFAGFSGVVMRVIVPKGMKVHGINAKGGQHASENEVILQRGLRYRVVADYGKHNGKRYIDVMVVPNPYAKAE